MSGLMRAERRGDCAGGRRGESMTPTRTLYAASAADETRGVGDAGRLASRLCGGGSWVWVGPGAALSGEGKCRARVGAAARARRLLVGLRDGECMRSRCPPLSWSSVRSGDDGYCLLSVCMLVVRRTRTWGDVTLPLPGDRRDMFLHQGSDCGRWRLRMRYNVQP